MTQQITAQPGALDVGAAPVVQPTITTRRTRRSRIEKWLLILPATAFQLSWGWYPLAVAFLLSFTDARVRGAVSWTGWLSYERMWADPFTWQAFRVTFTFAALSIVLTFMIPIIVAILLMEMKPRMMRWMMLLWFLPISGVANAVLWRYVYNEQYGLLQYVATDILGLPAQQFLSNSTTVLIWLIFPGLLLFGPGLIYMAGLQGIPSSYYEAAEVEGAGFWRKMFTISLPRLRPIIAMMLLFAIIGTLQTYDWPQLMTGGGPGGASRTVVMYMFSIMNATPVPRYADATAIAIFLFMAVMTITLVYRSIFKEDLDR